MLASLERTAKVKHGRRFKGKQSAVDPTSTVSKNDLYFVAVYVFILLKTFCQF